MPRLVNSLELIVYSKRKNTNKLRGFTLIELLVVIAIISILSVVGLAAYKGIQGRARDSKREGDIDAINKALEANYQSATSSYVAPTTTQFAGGGLPEDPLASGAVCANGQFYCLRTASSGSSFQGKLTAPPPATFDTYLVCAHLENAGTGNASDSNGSQIGSKDFYCRSNQQ